MTNKVLLLILLSGLLFSLTLDRIKTNLKWPAPIQKKTAYYSETSFELGRALFTIHYCLWTAVFLAHLVIYPTLHLHT